MNLTFLYLAALFFSGIWMWRRWGSPFQWRVAGLFYLLVLIFFFHSLVLSDTRLPVDHVLGMYPWRGFHDVEQSKNPETNDVILQMVPWAHQVRESWKRLEAPLWNTAAGGGYPMLANGQSAALSLIRALSLPLPLAQSFACEAALKVLIALSFAFLYMTRRGRSELAAVITAISYGFCTFVMIWLFFGHASVAAFLPAVFYAVDLLIEGASLKRVAFGAAVFTLVLLQGHPETAAHTMLGAGLYALFCIATSQVPSRRKSRSLFAIAGAGVLAVLMSLPFLLPFIEALPKTQRYEHLRTKPPQIQPGGPKFLMPFIQPGFYGNEHQRNLWGPGTAETACGYAGIFGAAGWFALLFHHLRTRQWRGSTSFYVFGTPFFLPIVLGWPPFSDLIHALPLFSLAANGRLRLVICWFLAVLAGEAVHLLVTRDERKPMIVGVSFVAGLLVLIFAMTRFPSEAKLDYSIQTTLPRLIVLLSAVLLLVRAEAWRTWAAALLIAAVTFDLWSFAWPWYARFPAKQLYPPTPLISELQRRQSNPEPGEIVPHRIAGTTASLFPNSAAMYGLEDIRAHDPMAFGRVLGALRVYTGYTSDRYFGFLSNIDDPFLDYLNVRYVISAPQEDYRSDRFIQIYSGPDGRIYQNRDALPRFYAARNVFSEFDDAKRTQMIVQHRDWANSVVLKRLPTQLIDRIRADLFNPRPPDAPIAAVRILSVRPHEFRLAIDAPRWTLIIGSQPNWPGWKIYRDAERLKQIEVNGAFMGFLVPPGRSNIRLVYAPRSFSAGWKVSLLTAALLAGTLVWQRLRRRKL